MSSKVTTRNSGVIPKEVLAGKVYKFKSVRTVFRNYTLQALLKKIYDSYLSRSHLDQEPSLDAKHLTWQKRYGRPDDKGNRWVQLKPRTYKEYKLDNDVVQENKAIAARRRSIAGKAVNDVVQNLDYFYDGINIRTGRLLASCYPGPIINNRLVTLKDQTIVENADGSFNINNDNVEYAAEIEASIRPIIPNEETMREWLQEATSIGLQAASREYQRLLQREEEKRNYRKRQKG